jgi:hypothetical protein
MKKTDRQEINSLLQNLKKKLSTEISESELIKNVTGLSAEITSLKKQKDYLENSRKILDNILSNYSYALDKYMVRVTIPTLIRDIEAEIKDVLKQIMYKSDKLDNYELMLDFITYDSFDQIMEMRDK